MNNLRTHFPFWILLFVLVLQRVIVLIVFNGEYTDSDQIISWTIARDYAEGNFYQPFMYGQDYGYMVESFLAVPLLWCGIPVEWALPIITNLLAVLPFLSFACWYKRKGELSAAMIVLAIPLLLPISYAMITSMPRGFINGLAFFALWPWIENVKRLRLQAACYGAVLMAALVTNPNTIFVAILLCGLAFFRSQAKLQFVVYALIGACIPALLHLWAKSWIADHPEVIVHHAWDLWWNMDYFMEGMTNVTFSYFRGNIPFTERYAHIAWLLFPAIAIYSLWRKKYNYAVLAGLISVGLIAAIGVNKVSDGYFNIFFPHARMFLSLPMVLALICAGLIGETYRSWLGPVLMIAGVIFTGVQVMNIRSVIAADLETKNTLPLHVEAIKDLDSRINALRDFAKQNSIHHFAGAGYPMTYGDLQSLFYAGECWYEDFPSGTLPVFDRRLWREKEIMAQPANTTAWLGGMDPQWAMVDTAVGTVSVQEVIGQKVYRVNSERKNEEVLRGLTAALDRMK